MAGSSIFAWMLLLLPLFVSFDQISAAPAPPLCKDTFRFKGIQTNIDELGKVVKVRTHSLSEIFIVNHAGQRPLEMRDCFKLKFCD